MTPDHDLAAKLYKVSHDFHAAALAAEGHAATPDGAAAAPAAFDWQALFATVAQILPIILALFQKQSPSASQAPE